MPAHVRYLHGFASSVRTAKGIALGERLRSAVASYAIPDLEGGDFRGMTMDSLRARAAAACAALPADGQPLVLIGSSLGGYLAALLAATAPPPRLAGLLLIAPAFGFPSAWAARLGPAGIAAWEATGERLFFHHASEREQPLGYGFLASCRGLPELPGQAPVPVVIVHGRQDDSVDHRQSIAYHQARARVELHLVEGDHRLTEPRHEALLEWCARDLLARVG